MKRTLGLLTALSLSLALVACSDEGGEDTTASDPSAPSSQSSQAPQAPDAGNVTILDQTGAGGTVDTTAVPLRSQADVDKFLADLSGDKLSEGVQRAFDKYAGQDGTVLLGSVVALGCDVPKDVNLSSQDGELTISAQKVAATRNECFAPVTSVALVTVDSDELAN